MATLPNLVYVPCVIAGASRNIPNGGAIQYGVETRVVVPVLLTSARVARSMYGGGAQFHIHDEPNPFNVSTNGGGSSSDPVGIQRWPLKA